MSIDEAWEFVEHAHTGVLTTVKRDGGPVSLPVWFAAIDRRIYVSTRGKKVVRVRNNPMSSFLVEDGERWDKLRAVHLTGEASVVEPGESLRLAIEAEMTRKYSSFRTEAGNMPSATRSHYESESSTVLFEPTGKLLTWDNSKIDLRQ